MTPNLEKIFEDTEPNECCENVSCSQLLRAGRYNEVMQCGAISPHECPRARIIADEVRQFIADNGDLLWYIKWV